MLQFFQSWDHRKQTFLLSPFQMGLEADDIIERIHGVILPQLHDRIRAAAIRTFQPDRLHRSKQQCLAAAARHLLKGHAALKVDLAVDVMHLGTLSMDQLFIKAVELRFVHRAVDVIRITPYHNAICGMPS